MNFEALFGRSPRTPVAVGVVGVGEFGSTFLGQARHCAQVNVKAVCDLHVDRAKKSLIAAGWDPETVKICGSRAEVMAATDAGLTAVVDDSVLLTEAPVDVVFEATGHAEAAAITIDAAHKQGRHTVIVTKEAEGILGPIFARRAAAANLVHTIVDGDQPAVIVGILTWANKLGLPVLAVGKAGGSEHVWNEQANEVFAWGETRAGGRFSEGATLNSDDVVRSLEARHSIGFGRTRIADLCEIGLVANHTGYMPDRPELHAPVARISELPTIFRPKQAGGLLECERAVDIVNVLRGPGEIRFPGFVFATIELPDVATSHHFAGRGVSASPDGRYLLLLHPTHLLGAEAPLTAQTASYLGISTGGADVQQRVDLVARATRDLKAGETLAMGGEAASRINRHTVQGLDHLLMPAQALGPDAPIPYYLAAENKLRRDVAAGTIICGDDVEIAESNLLMRLRKEQDREMRPRAEKPTVQ